MMDMPAQEQQTFIIELLSLTAAGTAFGRYEGRAIFVPFGAPGDHVRVRITQDKGRYAFAEIVEFVQPSSERIMPRCPHFGTCGGCHIQHLDYDAQLRFKQEIVIEQFRRIGGFMQAPVEPVIPSPNEWAYRTHATFHPTAEDGLGFMRADHRGVLPIRRCDIIHPTIEALRAGYKHPEKKDAHIRIQINLEGKNHFIAQLESSGDAQYRSGTPPLFYEIAGKSFRVSMGSFVQVNIAQSETLVRLVLEYAQLRGVERVADLYCGVGLFTAFLAENTAHVTAVEQSSSSILDAVVNLKALNNVILVEGAVEKVLQKQRGNYDVIVLDPPRAGLSPKALSAILNKFPSRIVYVSCDPTTLARDAKALVASGYLLVSVQPVDMFPQTIHIENVACFEMA